ncbi:major capsid protein [Paralysiella testudinis]|uniref:Major capsid protein n=1 Tax=Paralysiella testudinis TaxID=2809020 RepID=A0A892ZF69_9NEIS|nr:major capsid protein [Paralysiella testudinis]QRQ82075.1 major capsid protein [Paralysiella testudinis]
MSDYLKNLRVADPVLTTIAQGYAPNQFVAETIMPVVPIEKEAVKVPVHGSHAAFLEYDTERAVGADSNVITIDSNAWLTVNTNEHDLEAGVDYRAQKEAFFDQRAKAVRRVKQGVMLKQEAITARLVQAKNSYGTGHSKTLTGTAQWNDQANSDPLKDIDEAKDKVLDAVGIAPNIMVVGAEVLTHLRYHPKLQEQLGSNERKRLNLQILKDLFEVEEIIVGAARISDGKNFARLWGKNVALLVRGANSADQPADEGNPSFGYTFRVRGNPFADSRDLNGKVERVRYTDNFAVAVVGGNCGYLIESVAK